MGIKRDSNAESHFSRDYRGGPIIGSKGMVFGLAVSEVGSAQKINFAIPGKRLLSFLAPYYETVSRNSSSSISHFNLGRVYDEMNRDREAEMEYRKALRSNPNNAQANRAIGVLY